MPVVGVVGVSASSRVVLDAAPVGTEARIFSWASSVVTDGYSRLRAVAVLGDWSWSTVEVLGHRRGVARVWSAGSSALAGGPPPSRGPPSADISKRRTRRARGDARGRCVKDYAWRLMRRTDGGTGGNGQPGIPVAAWNTRP